MNEEAFHAKMTRRADAITAIMQAAQAVVTAWQDDHAVEVMDMKVLALQAALAQYA